ncbi:MAG: DNA starvation/stationary phase protection protein Dps [Phycisphaerales bacterium]|nr:DNA starvation/stationary phase protection protein Dps [Phycisphaerales bacterium]
MNPTRNDMPAKVRKQMVELCNVRLADAVDLWSQCKQAHWNVKGPAFIAVHELFDKVSHEVDEFADTIAERAVALGGTAHGTIRMAAKTSSLGEFPGKIRGEEKFVDALADAIAGFGKGIRAAIDVAEAARDKGTADLFTGMSREVDKLLWFVEAHNQD